MLKKAKTVLAASLVGALTGLTFGWFSGPAIAATSIPAWGEIVKDGNAGGTIHVTSGDGQTWTDIQASAFSFPVRFSAHALEIEPLNRVWVVQGDPLNVHIHDLYDTDDPGTGLQGPTFHSDTKTLSGATLNLSNSERSQIISACNAKLNRFSNEQPQHQTETQIPITLVMQTTSDGVGWSDGAWADGIELGESWESVNFTLPVICEGFTRETPAVPGGVATPHGSSELKKVELALSSNGVTATDTLKYSGSCPTGITLNMGWFTTLTTTLKSYVQHKNVVGSHDWNTPVFSVTTNQPAAGGLWKKEMSDFVSIPFGGSSAVGGAQVNHAVPNNGLQVGGSGGGGTPQNGLVATNTGGDSSEKKYVGFFRVVAYKSKKTVPAVQVGGGWTNKIVYSGQKFSPWRKYDITCEPQRSTVALDSPKDLVNPPRTGVFNPDDNPFPKPELEVDTTFDPATRDLTIPGAGAPKPASDVVRANDNVPERIKRLAAEARRKQATEEKRQRKLQAEQRRLAKIASENAAEEKRRRKEAAEHARKLHKQIMAAKKAAAEKATARRAANAAALAKKRAAEQAKARKRAAAAARKRTTLKSFARTRVMRLR